MLDILIAIYKNAKAGHAAGNQSTTETASLANLVFRADDATQTAAALVVSARPTPKLKNTSASNTQPNTSAFLHSPCGERRTCFSTPSSQPPSSRTTIPLAGAKTPARKEIVIFFWEARIELRNGSNFGLKRSIKIIRDFMERVEVDILNLS
ncbi:uncharacterized protein LY89DRAFT_730049 [Mollisia scopiformis]|uniref:Uncharacterized protein n=1 Tax=Mollisia scopiformis TaxID=149040 RepID=A0A194XND5_MOLSC|nr:uncharacterized protein LY89DRAFT_730049 [Mollisia scopiformis]KUJ21262.1 hypothetical protein LY89DRAFT_730049 [Mollisia scopiformis]